MMRRSIYVTIEITNRNAEWNVWMCCILQSDYDLCPIQTFLHDTERSAQVGIVLELLSERFESIINKAKFFERTDWP